MMDDVVGLVMVQVISNLGGGDIGALVIVRPVLVSVAFAVIVPLLCRFLVEPSTIALNRFRKNNPDAWLAKLLPLRQTALVIHTALLLALVAGASYAGTSNLFAAYIAGAVVSWWDSEMPHPTHLQGAKPTSKKTTEAAQPSCSEAGVISARANIQGSPDQNRGEARELGTALQELPGVEQGTSGTTIYERFYHQAVCRILQPLFFASIGFSIPITRMFRGSVVWRGIVYTILMAAEKLVCGLWLVRFPLAPLKDSLGRVLAGLRLSSIPHIWGKKGSRINRPRAENEQGGHQDTVTPTTRHTAPASKPASLHPPVILACAMTARGEIGFLISSVAESNGVFSSGQPERGSTSDMFLIVTWAIVLCTIFGPLGVGLSVRRVKRLEAKKNSEREGTGRDVLGVWGVE